MLNGAKDLLEYPLQAEGGRVKDGRHEHRRLKTTRTPHERKSL